MSNEKDLKVRIIHKHDTEANWLKATNFIPKPAELIIYEPDDTYDYSRYKIGDGVTAVNDLPFSNVQPDWNQNDTNAADYLKNKPAIATDEDTMDLMAELGYVTPVTSSDGSIYTSANGEIYSL